MHNYQSKINNILDKTSKAIEASIAVEAVTNWKLVKLNCFMCACMLISVVSVASLTMLINSECRVPFVGCLTIKVLSQIYKLILSTIAPQVFVVFILSLLIIKIRGSIYIKMIVTNLFFLSCINIILTLTIIYMANYKDNANATFFLAISIICPLISHFMAYISLIFLKEK